MTLQERIAYHDTRIAEARTRDVRRAAPAALNVLLQRRGQGHQPGCACQGRSDRDRPATALPCRELRRIIVAGGLGPEIWDE